MKELTLKYHQVNSDGLILLPSAAGRGEVKARLRAYKVCFEETMVRFNNCDVLAYKISTLSAPQYSSIETKWRDGEILFFILDYAGNRINFRLPLKCQAMPDKSVTAADQQPTNSQEKVVVKDVVESTANTTTKEETSGQLNAEMKTTESTGM